MNTYFALLLAVGINISVIAGSLIFFLWIADRYYDGSFEYKAAKIAVIWVDCLLSLITSAIVFKIIVQDLQDHPLLTTTLFIPIIVAISLYAIKHQCYAPVICVSIALPFVAYGIWHTSADDFLLVMSSCFTACIYAGLLALVIYYRNQNISCQAETILHQTGIN